MTTFALNFSSMITEDNIRLLLNDIENERVELTISTDNTDKFAKAVCAFANDLSNKQLPGYLLIGVFDDGKLSGLNVTDRLLRNFAGLRSDGNIQPKPALMVGKRNGYSGKKVEWNHKHSILLHASRVLLTIWISLYSEGNTFRRQLRRKW